MRKGIFLLSLVVFSVLVLGLPLFSTFASEPGVVITPEFSPLGGSFTFDITATGYTINYRAEVTDPDGTTWVLEGLTAQGMRTVKIKLPDAGDRVTITWPDAIITIVTDLDGDVEIESILGLSMSSFEWVNGVEDPHTDMLGTYSLFLSGIGCFYCYCIPFLVIPESILGTISTLLVGFVSIAVLYTRSRPRPSLT